MAKKLDVYVTNHGSIQLVQPLTHAARTWLATHVAAEATRIGSAVAVEPRYLAALIDGMIEDGLSVAV